jgi:hypothetical protein
MAAVTPGETCIRIRHDLWKLIARLVAEAKTSSTFLRQVSASGDALQSIKVSSAY